MTSRLKLPIPCLALVTDRKLCVDASLVEKVAQVVEGGVGLVQLREKDLPGGPLLSLARKIRELTQGKALFLVNERIDVALTSGADGVQLGEEAMPVGDVRSLVGTGLLIGRSVHSLAGALEAQEAGADFVVLGTLFPTPSKPGSTGGGLALVAQVAQATRIPVIGIGGIGPDNAASVVRAGAHGIAVMRGILASSNPRRAAMELRTALQEAWSSRRAAAE